MLEGFRAVVALLPQNLRNDMILIGGASVVSLGSNRKTKDVDIVVTVLALHAFYAVALHDPRFKKGPIEDWEYTSSSGIIVPFEFLVQGGGFMPVIRAAREILGGGGMVAGLGELAIMKARMWLARDDDKDLEDFEFLLIKMEESGESFRELLPEYMAEKIARRCRYRCRRLRGRVMRSLYLRSGQIEDKRSNQRLNMDK